MWQHSVYQLYFSPDTSSSQQWLNIWYNYILKYSISLFPEERITQFIYSFSQLLTHNSWYLWHNDSSNLSTNPLNQIHWTTSTIPALHPICNFTTLFFQNITHNSWHKTHFSWGKSIVFTVEMLPFKTLKESPNWTHWFITWADTCHTGLQC